MDPLVKGLAQNVPSNPLPKANHLDTPITQEHTWRSSSPILPLLQPNQPIWHRNHAKKGATVRWTPQQEDAFSIQVQLQNVAIP